jgi:hypothetical protein
MSATILVPLEDGREVSISAERAVFVKLTDGKVSLGSVAGGEAYLNVRRSVDSDWESVIEVHLQAILAQNREKRRLFRIPRKNEGAT